MASVNLAYNASGMVVYGATLTGTVLNTGFRVSTTCPKTTFDLFFTGATSVELNGAVYESGANSELTATLLDTSGNVVTGIGTNPINPALAIASLSVQNVTYFSGLTAGTTYWLKLSYAGSGNQILQSDAIVQLTGPGTPTISTPTGMNNSQIYSPAANGFTTGTDISGKVGREGSLAITTIAGATVFSTNGGYNGGIIRFKASMTDFWIKYYGASSFEFQLQTVPINGSSGVPTPITISIPPNLGVGNYGEWYNVATGLSSTSQLYEMYFYGGSGGLINAFMTSGGTGIDLTTTTAGLTRTKILAFCGDSRVQQTLGAPGNVPGPWNYSIAQTQQAANKQILNVGVGGESLQTLSASSTRYLDFCQGTAPTVAMVIDSGINDIKSGSPPNVATLNSYMVTFINKVRSVSGYSTVPIYVEAIKPYSGMTFAAINAYNVGYQSVVAAYNAGTAAGQSPSPDPNVFYLDTEAWNLAGIPWKTGGSFDGTNFIDGLHLDQAGYNIEAGFLEAQFLTASTFSLSGPTTGVVNTASTNFTVQPNASYTGTLTPATSGTGTFSPTSLTYSSSNAAQTFTYTPTTTAGSPHVISVGSSPTLTNSSGNINYAVTYPALVASVLTLGAPTNTSIAFTGTASSGGNPPYSYQAQTSPHGANTWTNNGSPSSSVPTSVTGLTASTNYDVRVVTTDAQPLTATSNTITSFTASSGGGTALTLTITKPSGNPVLSWTADSLATSYNVLRATSVGGPYTRIANPAAGTLTYTDTSEPAGTIQYAITSNH